MPRPAPYRRKADDPRLGEIRRRIVEARTKAGWTGGQVAEMLGISWAAYGDLERCRKPPTLERLWKVAEVLDIDPADLDDRLASTRKTKKPRRPS